MPFDTKSARLSTVGDNSFRLEAELRYDGGDQGWTIPAGFETDFATVPRVIQWLIPTYGRYTLAAILHDFFCVELGKAYRERRTPFITSRDTDGVFRRVMRELGVPFAQRWLIWTGVRWGALANRARRKGIARDLRLMVPVSILAAPIVVPATLIVTVGLLAARLISVVVDFFTD